MDAVISTPAGFQRHTYIPYDGERPNVATESLGLTGYLDEKPLLGPNMGMTLAVTLGDSALAKRAFKTTLAGIAVALTIALVLGWFAEVEITNPEIASRLHVSYADFVLALASGAVGALSFTSGAPWSLIGVMVAVALLPPLMVFGLLVGSSHFQASLGALLLLMSNVVCVNISGVAMFLFQGVRPNRWWGAEKANTHCHYRLDDVAGLAQPSDLFGIRMNDCSSYRYHSFPRTDLYENNSVSTCNKSLLVKHGLIAKRKR